MTYQLPAVGDRFVNDKGQTFVVIGQGTRGIVVEYPNGQTQLIDQDTWANMEMCPDLQEQQDLAVAQG